MSMHAEQPLNPVRRHDRRASSDIYLESTVNERLGLLPGEARQVKNVMVPAMTVASPHISLQDAADLMRDLDVPTIVVYEGNHLAGMITDRDLALSLALRDGRANSAIAHVMRTNVPTCSEDALVYDALSLMEGSNLNWLPVLNKGHHLVGVLSRYAAP